MTNLTWESSNDWESTQSSNDIKIESGTISLDVTLPDIENLQNRWTASSFNLTDGDVISSAWTDTQGNSNATVRENPVYKSSGPSGQPTVAFDGSGDAFDSGIDEDIGNQHSYYVVAKVNSNDGYLWGASSSGQVYFGNLNKEYYSGYGSSFTNASGFVNDEYRIHAVIADGSTWEWFDNGSLVASDSYSASGTVGQKSAIGSRRRGDESYDKPLDGEIAEVLRYTTGHDTTTRQSVISYLNNKYAIY